MENKHKLKGTIFVISMSIFLILILANTSEGAIDCTMCHKTDPGKSVIKAMDTIEITNNTCLKCHGQDYPPTPMGYNTHLVHIGKYSAKVDYLSRHPKVTVSCDNCHTNIGQNCKSCHIKNIPHIQPPLGNNCKGCHGELDKLFRHPAINLKIHDIFNTGNTTACTMCHNPQNMASLKLANGGIVPMQESHVLCYQCHSSYYNLWDSGRHYSNKTIPIFDKFSNEPGFNAVEWRKQNTCVNCHNPHNPIELYQLPIMAPEKAINIDILDIIESNLIYLIIAIIFIIIGITIFIIKKKKINLSELKLSKLKFELPRISLPKISIPISISVEKENTDKTEHSKNTNEMHKEELIKKEQRIKEIKSVTDYDKEMEKLVNEISPKSERKIYKYKKDIMFITAICIMLGSFYIIFGAFIPIIVVVSESMSPHIDRGDIIFYTDIDRVDEIRTFNDKNYVSFEDSGDVIIYRPLGEEDVIPYVHRAMYYVEQDSEMWPGGPKAPYEGYITKGDNIITNKKYDQQENISPNSPIKKEWIVGVARFRIPYIGYVRLILS